jgi:hypothetical protein
MEIYSADLVDQPAANPTGLFNAMSENTPEEVPTDAPVEEVKDEEVTPLIETVITSSELSPEVAEEVAPEVAEEIEPVSPEESLVSKEEFEVKGPEGTQNLPGEVQGVKPEQVIEPEISEEEAEKVIKTKLSAVVESFDLQKGEIISLRADLDNARIELSRLGGELEKRDLRIASLEETKRIALRAAGLLPSDVELEISSEATPFNAAEAYSAAVEAGNKQLAADLFKDHKKAIFAARNGK